jgi:hypothetical protein
MLHDLYNQLLVAISTNRTALLKYNDGPTCSSIMEHKLSVRCRKANTQRDCEQSLQRKATWLPLYDDWIPHITRTIPQSREQSDAASLILPVRESKFYTAEDWSYRTLMAFRPVQYYIARPTGSIWNEAMFQNHKDVLQALYSMGADYLYGMLFHNLFSYHPQIVPPEVVTERQNKNNEPPSPETTPTKRRKSYVLHSRHFTNDNDGTNTEKEFQCLQMLIGRRGKRHQRHPPPPIATPTTQDQMPDNQEDCVIYLMSDREVTIDVLTKHIRQQYPHCTPIVATHGGAGGGGVDSNDVAVGHYKEHGKWAGTGFLQDLMLGSLAQDGFIGHCYRSSSQLLREMIVYNRYINVDRDGDNNELSDLQTCCLPSV